MEGVLGKSERMPALKLGLSMWKDGVDVARGGADAEGLLTFGLGATEGDLATSEDAGAEAEGDRGSFLIVFLVPLGGMLVARQQKSKGTKRSKYRAQERGWN